MALFGTACALAGCVTQNKLNQYGEQTFGPMVGKHVSVAVERLGPPEEERAVLENRVVIWRRGNEHSWNCTITLTVDADNVIRAWDADGNDCVFNEIGPKKTFGKRSGVVAGQD
jgi:hypothetical protein